MTSAAGELVGAVRAWLEGLDAGQLAQATFPFDGPERFVWAYTPGAREGLAIRDMRPSQRAAANAIVTAATSSRAAGEIAAIIDLETVLGHLERVSGRAGWLRRDPELYWHAVFGEPGGTAPWSWRLGGHHVALHVTVGDDRVVGSTPAFLGANPAVIPSGRRAGERTLPGEDLLARELLAGLTPSERAAAVIEGRAPADILTGTGRVAALRSVPAGVPHAGLGAARQGVLERLIQHYLGRAAPDAAGAAWERILVAGLGAVTFAWAGDDEPGQPHYYAVRGPTFVIEYDNTQNGANHVHSVWRDLEHDWGGDALGRHLTARHTRAPTWRVTRRDYGMAWTTLVPLVGVPSPASPATVAVAPLNFGPNM
jgi:hypothetical protein